MMNAPTRKNRNRARVIASKLPAEDIRRPAYGDWSAREAAARRAMERNRSRLEAR